MIKARSVLFLQLTLVAPLIAPHCPSMLPAGFRLTQGRPTTLGSAEWGFQDLGAYFVRADCSDRHLKYFKHVPFSCTSYPKMLLT